MEFLKSLFESGAITWEQFSAAVSEKGYKVADLATGNYVAKKKYEDDLKAKEDSISDLNVQLSTRDADMTNLKKQLGEGGKDSETKISELTSQISKMQEEYEAVKTEYSSKLESQSYEFAVREFANGKKFTSNAAKRDFINSLISENLKMKDNTILGAEDFVKTYSTEDPDAFIVEVPGEQNDSGTVETKPKFVQPTPPQPAPSENAFIEALNFSGVRPKNTN